MEHFRPLIVVRDASLRVGVIAEVEVAPEGIIVADVTTGIFGVGRQASEATTDFLAALRDHARVLAAEEELAPDLQRQLAYLQSHLLL